MDSYCSFLQELTSASGKCINGYFGDLSLSVETKEDDSPVTRADREAEEILRDLIRRRYPSHGVIGEEYGQENATQEWVWIIDPIDGTKSFTTGCPLFGTLIGLLHEGQPVLGAIHLPALNKLCIGDGSVTRVNSECVRVRSTVKLQDATLLVTDTRDVARYQKETGFNKLVDRVKIFRTWGDCYGYFLLVSGWADIMVDPIMNPWDLLPLIPIVRGAGGAITGWDNGDAVTANSTVAAHVSLHPEVLSLLNQ